MRDIAADPLPGTAILMVLIAAVCAAWFGWGWYGAAHDDGLAYAKVRDEVLRSGSQAVQNLTTLDHRDLDRYLRAWQDSSTSELYQQIVQGRATFEADVRKARTITTAKVLEAAVTELDEHAGTAGIIAAVQITVTPPEGAPATRRSRLIGRMTRTAQGWKLSALGQAPVQG